MVVAISPTVGLNSYNHPKTAPQVSDHNRTKALTWEAEVVPTYVRIDVKTAVVG